MEGRLALQSIWDSINGAGAKAEGRLGGTVHTDPPWLTRYWFGGWDGDVMRGYAKGWLKVPFTPE